MQDKEQLTFLGTRIDSYDVAIMSALEENADQSDTELASRVHLSRTAVARRVSNLRDQGLIQPPRTAINYEKLGLSVRAFIRVDAPSGVAIPLREKLLDKPEVLSVSMILGQGLMMIEVVAVDNDHLHRFLAWLKDFASSETSVVLKKFESSMQFRDRVRKLDEFLSGPDEEQ